MLVRRLTWVALGAAVAVASCGDANDNASSEPATVPGPTAGTNTGPDAAPSRVDAGCTGSACTPTAPDANVAPDAAASGPYLAVFSAFPAEMAPLLAQAQITSTVVINSHKFSIGTLKGTRVALGLTGMGIDNATKTSQAVLAQLPVTGVVFSGVAGSAQHIGDVAVPTTWSIENGGTFTPDAAWLTIATNIIASKALCFEQCTAVPSTGVPVCFDYVPGVLVGGKGVSKEAGVPLACQANGDDVFGCEVGAPAGAPNQCHATSSSAMVVDAGDDPLVTDNETGPVAAAAAQHNLPFIAFRGISDGAGDPLHLPPYPAQFFAYYRLAARNAAATTMAFVEQIGKGP